jgi:hypothetical protein
MSLNALRFVALLLAALALGMHLAHALELAPKRAWDGELFLAVQSSLYVWFGRLGPLFEVGALLAVSSLAWRLRGRPSGRAAALSAAVLVLALVAWWWLVLPAHAQIRQWTAEALPADWTRWRDQWQFGQAGIFALHLVAFPALLLAVLRDVRD